MQIKRSALKSATQCDVFNGFRNCLSEGIIIPDITSNPYAKNNRSTLLTKQVVSILKIDENVANISKKVLETQLYPQYLLLYSLAEYLFFEAPPDEQNSYMICELLAASDEGQDEKSDLDRLFDLLSEKEQEQSEKHIALEHYRKFKVESGGKDKEIADALKKRLRPYFAGNDDLFEAASFASIVDTAHIHLSILSHTFLNASNGTEIRNSLAKKAHGIFLKIFDWYAFRRAHRLLVETLISIQAERREKAPIKAVIRKVDTMTESKQEEFKSEITIMDVIAKLDEMPESTPGRTRLKKATHFFSEFM